MNTIPATVRKSEDRGHANHGWLDSYHTFSFADYYDPDHMGFRSLRVINEDRVEGREGFGTHAHRDMEIVTYVLSGKLEHKDSMGTGSIIGAGEVQYMSAGSGVTHSEFNPSDERAHFLQIWILPNERGAKPRYGQTKIEDAEKRGKLRRIASPDGREGSIAIRQDVSIFASVLGKDQVAEYAPSPARYAWIQVARGEVEVNGRRARAGDGVSLSEAAGISLRGVSEESELLLFDLN